MAIGIYDLDDDDYGTGFNPQQDTDPNPQVVTPENSDDNNFISDFLKTRGILCC